MNAEQWNETYPVGTPVLAYPSIRPEHPVAVAYQKRASEGRLFGGKDPCKRLVTRTRTPAWTLGHAEPVVSVDGYAGGIVLDHVDVISEEQFATARADETAAAVAAQGALPVPVGDQPQPLDDTRLAEIAERVERRFDRCCERGQVSLAQLNFMTNDARAAVAVGAALLAEVQRLKAELAEQTSYALHLEAAICQCDPVCEGGEYLHVSDCPVTEVQMQSVGLTTDRAEEAATADVDREWGVRLTEGGYVSRHPDETRAREALAGCRRDGTPAELVTRTVLHGAWTAAPTDRAEEAAS